MNQSTHSTTDPPATAAPVTPLTQTWKKTGKLMERWGDVTAQITECLADSPVKWSVENLKSETLVHLVRRLPQNDLTSIGKVIHQLGRRIARIARDYSSGMNQSEAEEFASDIAAIVNALLFVETPNRQSEILEVAFRMAVQRHALKEREKFDERKSHVALNSSLQPDEQGVEGVIASAPAEHLDPEELAVSNEETILNPERVRKALAAISNPKHREAVILHFLKGWPIDSKESQQTLSTYFRKSGRQIQTWIKTAKEEMRTALGDET